MADKPDWTLAAVGLELGPVGPEEMPLVLAWEDDEEIARYIGKKAAEDLWWANWNGRRRHLTGIRLDGRLVGFIELRDVNRRARSGEIRMCIGDKSLWGRGMGQAALRRFVDLCFAEWGFRYLYLRVYTSNRRAIRCYQKTGFVAEGLLRAGRRRAEGHEDVLLMGLRAPGGTGVGGVRSAL